MTSPALARRSAGILAALVLAAVGAVAPALAAHADDASWTVRTASNDFGADRTGYAYTVDPGNTVDDGLVVANHGAEPLVLGVYAADGYTTKAGQFDVLTAKQKSTQVGAWVTVAPATVTVQPGQTAEVPFTLTVPENASPGDYAGAIVTSLTQPDTQQGINVDRRLGIRIALRVGGDLKPGLAVEDLSVGWDGGLNPFAGGDATVTYTLHNTGNAVLTAQSGTGLTGPFGWFPTAVATKDEPPQLLPGEKWKVTVPARDVPATFVLAATATATPIVKDASGSTSAMPVVSSTAYGAAVPWTAVLLLLIFVAAVVVALRLLPRLRARRRAAEDARVEEAVAAALAGAGAAEGRETDDATTDEVGTMRA
jgi:hypothetical protein